MLAKQAAKEAAGLRGHPGERRRHGDGGRVQHGPGSWMRTAALRTRHLDQAILPGCTRGFADDADGRRRGCTRKKRAFTEAELRAARELFVTSATSFVKPIIALDGAPVGGWHGGAPVTRQLFGPVRPAMPGAGAKRRPVIACAGRPPALHSRCTPGVSVRAVGRRQDYLCSTKRSWRWPTRKTQNVSGCIPEPCAKEQGAR